jgi:hypothetical protein
VVGGKRKARRDGGEDAEEFRLGTVEKGGGALIGPAKGILPIRALSSGDPRSLSLDSPTCTQGVRRPPAAIDVVL